MIRFVSLVCLRTISARTMQNILPIVNRQRGSSITNRSLVPEDLLRMLEQVCDRT